MRKCCYCLVFTRTKRKFDIDLKHQVVKQLGKRISIKGVSQLERRTFSFPNQIQLLSQTKNFFCPPLTTRPLPPPPASLYGTCLSLFMCSVNGSDIDLIYYIYIQLLEYRVSITICRQCKLYCLFWWPVLPKRTSMALAINGIQQAD